MISEEASIRDNYIKCKFCPDALNLPINIICIKCSRPLIKLTWLHFFIFLISICSIGFLIGYFNNILLPSLFVELGILLYLILLLREEPQAKNLIIFLSIIILPATFIILYANLSNSELNIFIYFFIGFAIFYLVIGYLMTWQDACNDYEISLIKGLSVITFSFFLFFLIVNFLFNIFNPSFLDKKLIIFNNQISPFEMIAFLRGSNKIRGILFIVTVIQIMFSALVNAAKNKILRPESLFRYKTKIYTINLSHENPLIDISFRILQAVGNIFIQFYKVAADIFTTILNILKIIFEYIFNFIKNYTIEIFNLIEDFIKIFLKTNFYFLKKYAIPLLLLFFIVIQTNFLIRNIFEYIQTGTLSYLINSFLNIFTIFFELVIFIWLITKYKFIDALNSVSISNIWVVFITFISALISSWLLWVVSQFLIKLPFSQIGPFTIFSTILIVMFLIGILITKLIKPGFFEKK